MRIETAADATLVHDNTTVAPITADEEGATPRVSFARGLTVALDDGFAESQICVLRTGDASGEASVGVAEIEGASSA